MENEHLSPGMEDGTIDVEGLLVEPQDGHLSMDSVICFDEKIPKNAMDIEDVSRNSVKLIDMHAGHPYRVEYSGSDTGIAQEGKDILNGEINFRKVEGEGVGGRIPAPLSPPLELNKDLLIWDMVLNAMPSDAEVGYFRLENDFCSMGEEYLLGVEFAESITNLDYGSSEGLQALASDCQIQESTDGSDTGSRSDLFITVDLRDCQNDHINDRSSKSDDTPHLVQANSTDVLPTQKRSRKPTQRYTDGFVDPISTYSKKRREVSSSTIMDKSLGVKDYRKCHVGPKAIKESPEESSVVAIQVPFGSLANKECSESRASDMVQRLESRNSTTKSKGKCVSAVDEKKRGDCGTGHRKSDGCVAEAPAKKKDATNRRKINDCTTIAVIRKKRDDTWTEESTEEASGRRKHHRLWTISEVRKLIEGVSQYGVGRWSRIKKLFFSASAHRTSVDLKDKWRNLLKASGMQDKRSQQGERKRNMAWRPLPKSILRRVCELATMYPYAKGERGTTSATEIARDSSPERSTDITLRDYRRIIRSIDGN